jgi:uncharacterized protein YbaP (TraB family)
MLKRCFLNFKLSFLLVVFFLPAFFITTAFDLQAKSAAVEQATKSCLWTVNTQSNKIYLLGSLHFFKQDAYPLSAVIENAYADSQILVFETDIDAMKDAAVLARMMNLGMYPEGQNLLQNIDESTRQLLEKKLGEFGMPIEAFSQFKPWFVAIQIEAFQLMQMGFSPLYGIDFYFLSKAKTAGKEVRYLESTEFQINLLSKMAEQDQNAFLKRTLKELESVDELAVGLVKFWKAGDSSFIRKFQRLSRPL